MISIEKDLNGKYRCLKCHRLVMLHEKFYFICDCNREEVEEYMIGIINKLREKQYSNSNYIL